VLLGDLARERRDVGRFHVRDRVARRAEQMMMLVERRFVTSGRAGVSERLDEPDIAQDVEGPVHGPQTHARQMPADSLEDRLSREMCAVFERSQDGGSLLREPILALEKTGIDTV